MAVHQFVSTLRAKDAVGNHTVEISRALRSVGIESDIYVENLEWDHVGGALSYEEYPARRAEGDILIYQFASHSRMADFLAARKETLVVNYHNVTPSSFFDPWDMATAVRQDFARFQLKRLAASCTFAIADSEFNKIELLELGYQEVEVVPVLFDITALEVRSSELADELLREKLSTGGTHWLFVGRIVPNKAQHDLIRAFAAYVKIYDSEARLDLIGGFFADLYPSALVDLIEALGLSKQVTFHGSISDEELSAYYSISDVFVSTSQHEGFCVPILEAFAYSLPVVALGGSAVSETLGDGGIRLPTSDPVEVAAAVSLVLKDPTLRTEMTTAGNFRLQELDPGRSRLKLITIVRELLAR